MGNLDMAKCGIIAEPSVHRFEKKNFKGFIIASDGFWDALCLNNDNDLSLGAVTEYINTALLNLEENNTPCTNTTIENIAKKLCDDACIEWIKWFSKNHGNHDPNTRTSPDDIVITIVIC